jgi:uncharacterized protein
VFVGLGTVINVATIATGSLLGILIGNRLSVKTRDLLTTVLGSITLLAAADALRSAWSPNLANNLPKGWPLLLILISLLLGALVGSLLGIEERLEKLGFVLKARLDPQGSSPFVDGFVSASLLFVIGPMAILGSISDGMGTGIQTLVLKSTLDGITSIAFASTLGWGVAVSALPVGVYQLIWTGIGFFLGNILSPYQVLGLTATGGVLLLGIAFRMLNLKQVPVGNLLPSLFIAPLLALALHAL